MLNNMPPTPTTTPTTTQTLNTPSKGKSIIFIEILVLVLFLGGAYYLYTQFSSPSAEVSSVESDTAGQSLLGPKTLSFMKTLNQERLSFKLPSDSELIKQLEDFSENIPVSIPEGRSNPFMP